MRIGRTPIAFLIVLALGFGALALAGLKGHHPRAFSLDVPDLHTVARLGPGQRACESPIASPSAFGGVRIWAGTAAAPGALRVTISDARGGRTLARGRIVVPQPLHTAVSATLNADVPAQRRLRVCLAGLGVAPVDVAGSAPADRSVRLQIGARGSPQQISLVALESRPRSFLSLMPTIFHRAGLFRPGWVGTWTFWALAVAVLGAAAVLGIAVFSAALEDDRQDEDDVPHRSA